MNDKKNVTPAIPTIPIGLGNFHKTLPHGADGLVLPANYQVFEEVATHAGNFDIGFQSPGAAKLINPQAGLAHDRLGPDPLNVTMDPPPPPTSDATAAEMTELYWMALLRDLPFENFSSSNADFAAALTEMKAVFPKGAENLIPGKDLPADPVTGALELTDQTLFRAGLPGEKEGPLVSQFFLHDIAYGTQVILQKQFPYRKESNYLTDWDEWLNVQNTGMDSLGNDYPQDNDYGVNAGYYEDDAYKLDKNGVATGLRRIRNMRDLARFVNKDALHQAYFNAALLLNNWNAPLDPGNPYSAAGTIKHQRPFGTLGGPHLLAQVSEVSARALRVVWRQKWLVYRRFRPEAYGGLADVQSRGKKLGLPEWVLKTEAAKRIFASNEQANQKTSKKGTYLLPLAFTAGSPAHPSYGAGHATVAGACVTILKAWFDEAALLQGKVMRNGGAIHPITRKPVMLVKPDAAGSDELPAYEGGDLTVGGELNKLASNVAIGRSMGGVHWRTDNTRSLRLGEQIATIILRRECKDYPEKPTWSYINFDGRRVTISPRGEVSVALDPKLEEFYNQDIFAPPQTDHAMSRSAGA